MPKAQEIDGDAQFLEMKLEETRALAEKLHQEGKQSEIEREACRRHIVRHLRNLSLSALLAAELAYLMNPEPGIDEKLVEIRRARKVAMKLGAALSASFYTDILASYHPIVASIETLAENLVATAEAGQDPAETLH